MTRPQKLLAAMAFAVAFLHSASCGTPDMPTDGGLHTAFGNSGLAPQGGTVVSVAATTSGGLLAGGTASAPTLGLLTSCGANQVLAYVSSVWTCTTPLTNSAGSNVITKSNGTNLVASSLSDNSTTVSTSELVSTGALTVTGLATASLAVESLGTSTIGNSMMLMDYGWTASHGRIAVQGTAAVGNSIDFQTWNGTSEVTAMTLDQAQNMTVVGQLNATGSVVVTGGCTGCGPTNAAGANIVPKSDGTNFVASLISDNGTNFTVNGSKFNLTESSGNLSIAGTFQVQALATLNSGTGAPGINCTKGDEFYRTDGGVGTTIYYCSATNTWTAVGSGGGGITNGAGNNVIMKSDGTNAIASTITDDGTTIDLGSSNFAVTDSTGATTIAGLLTLSAGLTLSGGHVKATGAAPTLSLCGSSPVFTGSDFAGTFTIGSGGTSCTVTFAATYTTKPTCIIQNEGGSDNIGQYTVSATALVYTPGAVGISNPNHYICIGH